MKTPKSHTQQILAILGSLFLASLACNLPRQAKPDTQATMNAALTAASANLLPTNTIAAVADPGSPNANTAQTAQSQTLTPTPSVTPETNPVATAASIQDNVFAEDLLNRNHSISASSSVIGPKDFVYSAYLFINNRIDPAIEEPRPEICRLAIYRQDVNVNELIYSFTTPRYAPNNRYGYPAYCEAINWDSPSQNVVWGAQIAPETRALLGLNGYWSDINQNGLPEFAIYYQYCVTGCLDYGAVAVHFYEIKNTYQPADITAELPGVIHPWNIVHRNEPLDIWVYDHTQEYEPLVYIESSWIYAWDGTKYKDVSTSFQAEYQSQIDQIANEIRTGFGQPITTTRVDMLQILMLSNKSDLPQQQTLQTFLDISNPAHWPGTNPTLTCWLQLARAYAQRDVVKGRPFTTPPNEGKLTKAYLEDILEVYENYDLSACESLP
jgi:hypothetical protein